MIALAHALVDDAAEACGVDYLVIKGLGAQSQGVSPRRTPSDVDVLVVPSHWESLHAELERRGWTARTADVDIVVFPRHSVSLFHPDWSCDIDLHFRFPGFDVDPHRVFRAMWSARTHFDVAGRRVPVPEREAAVLIAALHCLRSPSVPRHETEYEQLLATAHGLDGASVVARALDLGAGGAAAPFLRAAWPGIVHELPEPSEEWALRTAPLSPNARRIRAFSLARGRARWRALRIALWPGADTLVKERAVRPPIGRLTLLVANARRWGRGVVGLPAAVRELRRLDEHDGR
jgi:hypothetical protein